MTPRGHREVQSADANDPQHSPPPARTRHPAGILGATVNLRTFGSTGWTVSEIGYGMWGMGSWTGSSDDESMASLERAVELGCNFFDTAWAYGQGHSERLLGRLLRARPSARLYCASKIPPKNLKWPATAEMRLDDTFPPDHIREFAEKSLENIGVGTLDLLQFPCLLGESLNLCVLLVGRTGEHLDLRLLLLDGVQHRPQNRIVVH